MLLLLWILGAPHIITRDMFMFCSSFLFSTWCLCLFPHYPESWRLKDNMECFEVPHLMRAIMNSYLPTRLNENITYAFASSR